ncbi:MAG TPA: hypothetical protein PKA13_25470 [Geminicoccaceae bacterium]|nr:hypothetical protein [Geminicoccus sp.]HMU53147.1 hypothetical protein [Geminicoccaceae bacterium]
MREDERTSGARTGLGPAADQVVDEARRATATARAEAADLAGKAREQGMRQMEAGREKVAERLEAFAGSIHDVSRGLQGRETWLAELLDKGAEELSGLAGTLQRRDLSSLVDGLQGFARRQPALFAGASVALGFAAVRLARSASERREAAPAADHEPAEPTYGGHGLHEAAARTGNFGTTTRAGD